MGNETGTGKPEHELLIDIQLHISDPGNNLAAALPHRIV